LAFRVSFGHRGLVFLAATLMFTVGVVAY
jgi:hypothetical protein